MSRTNPPHNLARRVLFLLGDCRRLLLGRKGMWISLYLLGGGAGDNSDKDEDEDEDEVEDGGHGDSGGCGAVLVDRPLGLIMTARLRLGLELVGLAGVDMVAFLFGSESPRPGPPTP